MSTTSAIQQTDLTRDRAIRLFTFLRELTELRTKAIRTLDQYEKVLWLSDIPHEEGCFCASWNIGGEQESDAWIQVRRPRLSDPPKIPAVVQGWIRPEELSNSTVTPKLQQILAVDVEDSDTGDIRTEYRKLAEQPQVVHAWNEYLRDEWSSWAEVDKRSRQVVSVYTELFSIYQRQQRLGEAYEVVLGTGYLSWATPSGQIVRRHLTTAQTSISFDAVRGIVTVGPAGEGARPELEQDMLEAEERPDTKEQSAIEAILSEMGDGIFDGVHIFSALEAWTHAITPSGEFHRSLESREATGSRPVVTYAPALILRKRTERSLIRIFKEIAEQLRKGVDIPTGVKRIVTILDDGTVEDGQNGSDEGVTDSEIYFPDLANEEQLEIVRKFSTRQGVLVQGPPGTGKSHTIANLIAHLLAQGQRVLVTSHTARALRVLKDKIAPEISDLCVLVLGDDIAAMHSLEDSVRGITERYDHWNEKDNNSHIAELQKELMASREAEARALRRLREVREAETYRHSRLCGEYDGTAQQIAQRVIQEQSNFEWIGAEPPASSEPPLRDEEAITLIGALRRTKTPEAQADLSTRPFDIGGLLSPERFLEVVSGERAAGEAVTSAAIGRHDDWYIALSDLPLDRCTTAVPKLDRFLSSYDSALSGPNGWNRTAASEIVRGQRGQWAELHRISVEKTKSIASRVRRASEFQVSGIAKRDLAIVRAHAENLLAHLAGGKSLGFGPFRAKVVKEGFYLTTEVVVDGKLCREADALSKLLTWIEIHDILASLRRDWGSYAKPPEASPALQLSYFESAIGSLQSILSLSDQLAEIKACLGPIAVSIDWAELENLRRLHAVLKARLATEAWKRAGSPIADLEKQLYLESLYANCHPELRVALEAVRKRDTQQYAASLERLLRVHERREDYQGASDLLEKLRALAPDLVQRLEFDPFEGAWDDRLAAFRHAWNWARCNRWLVEFADPKTIVTLSAEVETHRGKIRDRLRRIAAARAWHHCFAADRLKEEQRQHLRAWAAAVRRIGRGTGRHANLHRRAAREHMEHCRPAIPGWIMPIFRVAETIPASPNAFDVVIVDEASQSGPEALFLAYIAKKMVVVGDDKQISPDFIGLNHDDVNLLRQRRIADVPHADALGIENSFFDIAAIRYSGRIRLREHFRCMPEIIQFSNNLCYKSEPLVPLRQYGSGRLAPVATIHVENGYQKGMSPRISNPPEAEAIAAKIAECCLDPRYEGKSFGVISLLGEDQARIIERLLLDTIGPEQMEERRIVCGDAYAFQGDERDVMFLSLVSAPTEGHRIGTLSSPKDERRFNVAVSRARDQVWLFHTATLNDLSPRCLRYRLLEYCQNPHVDPSSTLDIDPVVLRKTATAINRRESSPPDPFGSWFEVDVYVEIAQKGYRVIPQFEVAGYYIDLVVEGMLGRIAVECDGDEWHGPDKYSEDMARQRQLERCGWKFWRVRGSHYYRNPTEALESLWTMLESHGIQPRSTGIAINARSASVANERVGASSFDQTATLSPVHLNVASEDDLLRFSEQVASSNGDKAPGSANEESPNEQQLIEIFARCIPAEGKIRREELLEIVAHELGFERVTRAVRHHINVAISRYVQAELLKTDHNWDHVWWSSKMTSPGTRH